LPAGPRGPGISSRPVWTPGKHGVPAIGGVILINSVAASIPSAGTRHPTPAGCLLRPAPPPHRSASIHSFSLHRYLRFTSALNTCWPPSVRRRITFS